MAKERKDLKKELRSYRFTFDLVQKIPCTKQENTQYAKLVKEGGTLPEGVFPYEYDSGDVSNTEFYTIYEPDLTQEEKEEYLVYKKLTYLKTIKNCMVFFVVLTVLGILFSFFVLNGAF